eukprot:6589131-Lingulodinium_polyedra.AAC.1
MAATNGSRALDLGAPPQETARLHGGEGQGQAEREQATHPPPHGGRREHAPRGWRRATVAA